VWDAPTAYIVHLQWRSAEAHDDRELFQVLRVHEAKIVEMADYRSLGSATKTAKRFAQVTAS
jgi:hypothetical protein